jgi:hypothetical protein
VSPLGSALGVAPLVCETLALPLALGVPEPERAALPLVEPLRDGIALTDGEGVGEDCALAVIIAVGVGDGTPDLVALADAGPEGEAGGEAEPLPLPLGKPLDDGTALAVKAPDTVVTALSVASAERVPAAEGVPPPDALGEGEGCAVALTVTAGEGDARALALPEAVAIAEALAVCAADGDVIRVARPLTLEEGVEVALRVAVRLAEPVAAAEALCSADPVALGRIGPDFDADAETELLIVSDGSDDADLLLEPVGLRVRVSECLSMRGRAGGRAPPPNFPGAARTRSRRASRPSAARKRCAGRDEFDAPSMLLRCAAVAREGAAAPPDNADAVVSATRRRRRERRGPAIAPLAWDLPSAAHSLLYS